jgi:hypothetical protein
MDRCRLIRRNDVSARGPQFLGRHREFRGRAERVKLLASRRGSSVSLPGRVVVVQIMDATAPIGLATQHRVATLCDRGDILGAID